MKRILTLATTGLFVTGLALLPVSGRADPAVTGGKAVTSDHTASAMTPGTGSATSGGQTYSAPVKKDDKNLTVTPGSGTTAAPGGAAAKTPAKGS
jgi:hypothetical protein